MSGEPVSFKAERLVTGIVTDIEYAVSSNLADRPSICGAEISSLSGLEGRGNLTLEKRDSKSVTTLPLFPFQPDQYNEAN